METETIGKIKLYCGDARDMPPFDARCVVTDPPYKLTSGGSETGQFRGKFATDRYNNDGSIVECNISWAEIFQVIKRGVCNSDQSHIYCMANNREKFEAYQQALYHGLHYHNTLVWDKGTAVPNRWYMKNLEFTLFFKHGPAYAINNSSHGQRISCPAPRNAKHPTEKPWPLMAHYIRESTQIGETVYDPFMGVGTTMIACAKEKRAGVGVEISREYFDIACKRVEEAYKSEQRTLFDGI